MEPTVEAGTIGLELLRYPQPLHALLVPLGNGALLAGIGHWVKAYRPEVEVVGVCAAGAPAMEQSWRSGHLVTHEPPAFRRWPLTLQRLRTTNTGLLVRCSTPSVTEPSSSLSRPVRPWVPITSRS